MEILIGAVVVVGALYYIWSKSNKPNTAETAETPAKTETVVTSDIAIVVPVEEKPAKKTRTAKPKAPKAESKPKAEAKPKAPRKPKMKVAK